MPVPVTSDLPPDVIAWQEPERWTRWRLPLLAVGCGVAGVLVGAIATVTARDDTGAVVVDASGTMVAEPHRSAAAGRAHSTATREDMSAEFSGPIRVALPDQQLIGFAELTFSFAATLEDTGQWITHHWGEVHATFGSTDCDGPIAWSLSGAPHEPAGSMSLRCDDGSLFAATVLKEPYEDEAADHSYRVSFTLEDGSYVAG